MCIYVYIYIYVYIHIFISPDGPKQLIKLHARLLNFMELSNINR